VNDRDHCGSGFGPGGVPTKASVATTKISRWNVKITFCKEYVTLSTGSAREVTPYPIVVRKSLQMIADHPASNALPRLFPHPMQGDMRPMPALQVHNKKEAQ
jgi:hypothetical protein